MKIYLFSTILLYLILSIIHLYHCKGIIYHHKNTENNLYFVFTTFRHGARKPLNIIDFFGNRNYSAGALTEYGKLQHLKIGRKYRKRYSNFINISFDKNEIYIRSTNIMRTIVSTEKELEGFFNKTINRSYIFIVKGKYSMNLYHFDNQEQKEMEKYLELCPKRNLAKNYIDIYNREIFPNIKKCYLMKNISDSGMNRFCDSIISHYFEYEYGNETNNIISRCGSENIKKFYNFCVEYFDSIKGFNEYRPYMIYKFFQQIFKYMHNAIKKISKIKMIMIGGHDITVSQIMDFLDALQIIPRTHYPHFAFNMVIELRKYNHDFYLEFYYNDILKYNNTLEKFKNILDNSIYSNLYNYCGIIHTKLSLSQTINDETKIVNQNRKSQKKDKGNFKNKNRLNSTKNGINKLNNNTIFESLASNYNDTNEIKEKKEAILINYENNLLRKILNSLYQYIINFYFEVIIVFIVIAFLIKFSMFLKEKNKKKRYINFKKNLDKISTIIQMN